MPKVTKTALIIFAKRPSLGFGKQRLATETSKEIAFQISQQLLQQTISVAECFSDDIIISPSSVMDVSWSHQLFTRNVISIPQREGGLGQRLMQVDQEARLLGYENTLFIGTDAPLLKLEHIEQCKRYLENYQQVFIPATDGGVTLMANSLAWSNLDQIEWSTEKVFTQLKSIAIMRGLSIRILDKQTDLDDLEAYKRLKSSNKHLDQDFKQYSILDQYL